MVPQGQLAYYTPTPATPAPPLYQVPPFQFPQPFHPPYMPAASPASSSEPFLYGHPSHPVSNVASAAPSSIYPSSSHHTNFTLNAGSEQVHNPSSCSNGGTLPCQWQGQDIPPSSSPPPPPYPPGFEPKQDDGSVTCISASSAMGNPCAQPFHPHPHALPHPHTHPNLHPPSHSHPHPHLHVNALPQLHQPPPPFSHPHPPSVSHNPSSQTACHTPMLLPSVQTAHLPMGHGFDANRTVIGVPVMGTPVYGDGTRAAPPSVLPHGQQPFKTLQPKYGRMPMSSGTSHQPRKTTFHLTRYFQGNTLHGEDPSKGERNAEQIAWKPSNSQTQRIGMDRHATSRFWDSSQRPVPSKVDNASPDFCLSAESNRQPHVPLRELRFGTNGRQPPNTRCWGNQAQPYERSHPKACCPAKEIALPKSQDGYVDGGQEKLSLCQSSEHIGNLQCEIIRDRPDEQILRLNAVQQSSLALACSEAQLSSHVECEETACSGELVKEHEMESASTCEDSKIAPLPSVKKQEGLSRWLQERRHKYPTPANILRKAEERRKREELGEFDIDKPQTRLQHIRGVFSKCYHRGERPRIDNKMKHREQYIDNRQVADTGSRDEGVGSCERNGLADSCQSANGSEVAEKEGPVESLPFQGEVTELKKGIQSADSQSILTSDEIVEQNNHEKTSGPGHVFPFRRKRRRRNSDRSTSGVQRQKQLLFKILDRDIEKENSYLLQCCRFIVNNHFLQGLSNVKHFKWVGAGKPSSVNKSSSDAMHDLPACARKTEMPTPEAQDISTEKIVTHTQASANDGGQEHTSLGKEDDCQDSNEPCFATVENAVDDNVLVKDAQHASALPPQELSCSNQGQELIEDAHHTPLLPPQETSCSGKEQDPIIVVQYDDPGSQNRFFNGSHWDKEAPFPWKYSDGYFHQKNIVHGLATRPYDCFREPFCSNGLIADSKHASLLYSSSNSDAQGPAPFLWERSTNEESQLPDHEMDTGEVGSGISDHSLNDDDDILQYMNFDAFETDSGICFV